MNSLFAVIFVGPCFKINLFGYDFGFCEVSGAGATVVIDGRSWVEVYLGPFGQTTLYWDQIISYVIIILLVGFVGLSIGYIAKKSVVYVVKKTQQNKDLETDRDIQPVRDTDASPLKFLRQKLKLPGIVKIIFLSAVILVLFIIFGPYILPGIICGFFIQGRPEVVISIGATGGLIILYSFVNVGWSDNIELPYNVFGMILNWGVASVFFLAGLRMPQYFREGFRTASVHGNSGNQQNESSEPPTRPE